MRWLFLFVLLINIAYVGWEFQQPAKDSYTVKAPNSKVESLVLVSELESQVSVKSNTVTPAVIIKPDIPDKVSKKAAAVDTVAAKDKEVEKKANTKRIDAKVDEKKPKSKPISVKKSKAKLPKKIAEKPLGQLGACYTLGPYRELDDHGSVTRAIDDYVANVSFRSREEQGPSTFWVYLPAEGGKKEAKKVSKRLIKKKITDHYIINSGLKINGISLGRYKIKNSAYNLAKRLKKLGFKPVVEPVFKVHTIYWLDYQMQQGKRIPKKLVERHMTKSVNQLNRHCRWPNLHKSAK